MNIFNMTSGKLYKMIWIRICGEELKNKRMPYHSVDAYGYLDTSKILMFLGKLDSPNLIKEKNKILAKRSNGFMWGLFLYDSIIIAMEFFGDVDFIEIV